MNIKISRRQFIKGAAVLGVGTALPLKFGVKGAHAFYQSPGLQKWQTTLRGVTGPQGISVVATVGVAPVTGAAHATINIQQFSDQLHPALAPTTLWGFQPENFLTDSTTARHLGGVIVAQRGAPIQFTFRNKLTSTGLPGGAPLKGIIPVDTTLPGANQAQNRTAIHLHGGLVPWISDGGPFDWWGPDGTHGMSFLNDQVLNPGAALNEAEYYYPNNQSARLLWYHDHAFGITRVNAYAGIASAYIIRDNYEAGLVGLGGSGTGTGLPAFIEAGGCELPIVIQDKVFVNNSTINSLDPTWGQKGLPTSTGSLWYPHVYEKNRWRLLGAGRNLPNPSVIAEMFGDTMLVNGTVYPQVSVEARRYRLRILNACNARFLNLQLYIADGSADGVTIVDGVPTNPNPGPNWLVLGNEAGFLRKPVTVPSNVPFFVDANGIGQGSLITGNAERWDAIVDFSSVPVGSSVVLYNDAPAPFPGGDDRNDYNYDYYFGNSKNPNGPRQPGYGPDTRVIMKFNVGPATAPLDGVLDFIDGSGNWRVPPAIDPPLNSSGVPVRRLTLNETFDGYGRLTQMLGTDVAVSPGKFGQPYINTPTETVTHGTTEIWEIGNLTADAHPIHFHLVNVQVLRRYPFNPLTYTGGAFAPTGADLPADPLENGWKETVKMHPGTVTQVLMKFDLPSVPFPVPPSPRTGGNEYVWHCHILEHEEHDMMRPLVVT